MALIARFAPAHASAQCGVRVGFSGDAYPVISPGTGMFLSLDGVDLGLTHYAQLVVEDAIHIAHRYRVASGECGNSSWRL